MPTLTFYHPDQQTSNHLRDALNQLAAQRGYSSPRRKRGSAVDLLAAIAYGEIALVLLPDEQREWAIGWIEEQARGMEHVSQAEALRTIAGALNDAARLKERADDGDDDVQAIISVANFTPVVSRAVWLADGAMKYEPADNWEDLADAAEEAVAAMGGTLNISANYPCPPDLAARARW